MKSPTVKELQATVDKTVKILRGTPEYAAKLKRSWELDINISQVTGRKGVIYSRVMKCEFPSGNLVKDTANLVKEYLSMKEAEE